jgi:hypothetical protein
MPFTNVETVIGYDLEKYETAIFTVMWIRLFKVKSNRKSDVALLKAIELLNCLKICIFKITNKFSCTLKEACILKENSQARDSKQPNLIQHQKKRKTFFINQTK